MIRFSKVACIPKRDLLSILKKYKRMEKALKTKCQYCAQFYNKPFDGYTNFELCKKCKECNDALSFDPLA